MSLGVVMSALEIFERLQLWEDVVSCYQLAGKLQKAETIVEQQLDIHPNNPKLLCIMGDLKGDLTWYEKAWQVSNGRFARAMRSLGAAHFKQNNHALASECYQNALRINPLFDNSWYILGCCAMRLEDWELASTAFLRVINIDHEVIVKRKDSFVEWRSLV
jgi:tetratricopeptide (TPR) repeat protein